MTDLIGRIVEIERKQAESERRTRSRRRTGTIEEVDTDKGRYRVKFGETDGKPFLGPWCKTRQIGAGNVKIDVVLKKGEQVDVCSENGDLTDAWIEMSAYSDDNKRANKDTPVHVKVGDESTIEVKGDEMTFTSGKIHLK